MFGITETTVHVTLKEITENDIETNSKNIGTALPTSNIYIVDTFQNKLPENINGEIVVEGYGVAKGYLNNVEETNNKFRKNENNSLHYYSGDFGIIDEKGNVIYLGRIDHQVQIRGYRVELPEIELAIRKMDNINDVMVIAKRNEKEEQFLYAYYLSDHKLNAQDIKKYISEHIPHYMIPSYFIHLKEFPLTRSGKVDIMKLPSPTRKDNYSNNFVEPRNDIEKKIKLIWLEVLDIDTVGITDNFFDIGGNSLSAIKLSNKLNEVFNNIFLVTTIFKYPTIESLLGYINNEGTKNLKYPKLTTDVKEKRKKLLKTRKMMSNE
jgi:hypothetical protein